MAKKNLKAAIKKLSQKSKEVTPEEPSPDASILAEREALHNTGLYRQASLAILDRRLEEIAKGLSKLTEAFAGNDVEVEPKEEVVEEEPEEDELEDLEEE